MKNCSKFVLFFISILFLNCNLTHYSDQRTLSLTAKFPKRNLSNSGGLLAKPLDADKKYIPSFIDKISISFKGTSTLGEALRIDVERDFTQDETPRNNEFDVGDIPYGTYSVVIKAYTYNEREAIWIETHNYTEENFVLGSGPENEELFLILNPNHDGSGLALDNEPIDTGIEYSYGIPNDGVPPYAPSVCETVGPDGKYALSAFLGTLSDMNLIIHFFDSKGNIISESTYGETVYSGNVSESCGWFEGQLVLPHFTRDNSEDYSNLLLGTFTEEEQTRSLMVDDGTSSQNVPVLPFLVLNSGKGILFWNSGSNGRVLTASVDRDLNIISGKRELCSEGCLVPYAIAISDNLFLSTYLYANLLKALISNSWGYPESQVEIISPEFVHSTNLYYPSIIIGPRGTFYAIYYRSASYPQVISGIYGNSFDSKLENVSASVNLFPLSQDSNKLRPSTVDLGNSRFVLTRVDDKDTGTYTGIFHAYYSLHTGIEPSQGDHVVFEPDGQQWGYSNISMNDDGLAFISGLREDGKLFFKRYLF